MFEKNFIDTLIVICALWTFSFTFGILVKTHEAQPVFRNRFR